MSESEKSHSVRQWLDSLQANLSEETLTNLEVLLGIKAQPNEQSWILQPLESIAAALPFPIVTSKLDFSKERGGSSLIIFSKEDAIWMGATQAQLDEEALSDKIASMELDGPDFDSFAEICKQLSGILDQVVRQSMNDEAKLEYSDTTICEQSEDLDLPFTDGQYLLFPIAAEIENRGQVSFFFVLSTLSVEKWFDVQIDWSVLQNDEFSTHVEEPPNMTVSSLFIRLHPDCNVQLQEMLREGDFQYASIKSYQDLSNHIERYPIKLLVIQTENQEETGIKMCSHIIQKYLKDRDIPIWIQGAKWESNLVRLAWQAGADLCVKTPIDMEMIRDRLMEVICKN